MINTNTKSIRNMPVHPRAKVDTEVASAQVACRPACTKTVQANGTSGYQVPPSPFCDGQPIRDTGGQPENRPSEEGKKVTGT
jgi:hypothetical protein